MNPLTLFTGEDLNKAYLRRDLLIIRQQVHRLGFNTERLIGYLQFARWLDLWLARLAFVFFLINITRHNASFAIVNVICIFVNLAGADMMRSCIVSARQRLATCADEFRSVTTELDQTFTSPANNAT